MPAIELPEEVLYRRRLESQMEALQHMKERHGFLKWFDQQLKGIDPLLELVKASDKADDIAFIPGCWHIKRNNAGTMPTYYPISDEFGNFKEPDSGDLDRLRSLDTQGKSFDEMIDWKRREDLARADAARAERRAELSDTIRTMNTPSILVKRDIRG